MNKNDGARVSHALFMHDALQGCHKDLLDVQQHPHEGRSSARNAPVVGPIK